MFIILEMLLSIICSSVGFVIRLSSSQSICYRDVWIYAIFIFIANLFSLVVFLNNTSIAVVLTVGFFVLVLCSLVAGAVECGLKKYIINASSSREELKDNQRGVI